MEGSLCFTKEQILSVLQDFITFFESDECRRTLTTLVPHQDRMEAYIEAKQHSIFQKYGVNPMQGVQDLKRIPAFYKGDREIMPLLMSSAMREENLLAEALGEVSTSSSNNNSISFLDPGFQQRLNTLQIPQLQNQFEAAQKDGNVVKLQQLQVEMQNRVSQLSFEDRMRLQQQMMLSMTPEERQMIQQQQISQLQQQLSQLTSDQRRAAAQQMLQQLHIRLSQVPPDQRQLVQDQVTQLEAILQNQNDDNNNSNTPTPPELFKKDK